MLNMSVILYTARHVFPVSAPPIVSGAVATENGRIVAVGTAAGLRERYPGAYVVNLGKYALLPGLVNAHTHLELTHHAGHVPDSLPLIEWIYPLVSYSRTRTPEDFERAAYTGVEMLKASGTVAVGEICTFGQSVRPLIESGLHGIVYYGLLSPDPARADELLRKGQQQIERWRREYPQDRIRFGLAPHTPYTVSAELLRATADWCRAEGVPLSIHTAESPPETQFLRDATGPIADLLYAGAGWPVHPERAPTVSPVAYLELLDVLATQPLLAHGVHVDAGDVARIAHAEAAVTHCPRSNTRLRCGRMPYKLYRTAGVRLALGTDSLASSPSLAVWDDAIAAHGLHSAAGETPTPTELLRLATLGGADALGLADELGTLEPGKLATMACIPLDALSPTEQADADAVLAALVVGRVKPEALPSTSSSA
ncbi:MAG TPA: amidohydrolase family protein [Ktedonobacterales bacterium]|nr:amidohydrolase family protein [Ktedonobacterales bacterium]